MSGWTSFNTSTLPQNTHSLAKDLQDLAAAQRVFRAPLVQRRDTDSGESSDTATYRDYQVPIPARGTDIADLCRRLPLNFRVEPRTDHFLVRQYKTRARAFAPWQFVGAGLLLFLVLFFILAPQSWLMPGLR